MSTEKEQITTVKALPHVISEGSLEGAVKKVNKGKRFRDRSHIDLPPIEKFKKILKKAGVNERTVAESLCEMFQATKQSVSRNGDIHEAPDNPIRLKAIELFLKYYVPLETKGDTNHLHLHGDKKVDELLNKARGNKS